MPKRRHGRLSLRRWFQFRLRTIFIVTTLIALAVGWVAYMMHRARFQANAVDNVQSLGGAAYYGYQFDQDQNFISMHVRPERTILHETFGDDAVENIVCVDLNHTQAGDADLKKLDRLTRIRRLHLASTKVTDAGIAHLSDMSQLEFLDLRFTGITDDAVPRLAALENLKRLWLIGSRVSPEGVLELRRCLTACEVLWRPFPKGPFPPQAVQPDPLSPTSPDDPPQSPARYFNSTFPLEVYAFSRATYVAGIREPSIRPIYELGRTPSKFGVAVPRNALWLVEAGELAGDEQRLAAFIVEADAKRVPGISFGKPVSDATCRRLADLKHLQSLSLEDASNISQRGLQHLAKIQSLRMLHLSYPYGFHPRGLSHLRPLAQLHTLSLGGIDLPADALAQLAGLEKLTTLRLSFHRGIGTALTRLPSLPQLKTLQLHDVFDGLTDSAISAIVSISGLQSLRLYGSNPSKQAMRHLAASRTLTSLELGFARSTDDHFDELACLQRLTRLALAGSYITDDDLRHLQRFRKLRYLDLRHTKVTSAGLEHIKSLPCLESLFVTDLDDAALSHIAHCPSLRELHVDYTELTDNGLALLAGMSNLRKLVLLRACRRSPSQLTDVGVKKLAKLRNLQWLDLSAAECIGPEGIASLASLPNLEVLRLGAKSIPGYIYRHIAVSVSADAFVQFKHLNKLRVLDLHLAKGIDTATLQQIGAIPSLETLLLSGTGPISDGASILGGMPNLTTLVIDVSQLEPTVMQQLRTFAPQLKIIAGWPRWVHASTRDLWSTLDGVYPEN